MIRAGYSLLLILGLLCLGLVISLFYSTRRNQEAQLTLQARQQALSTGLFGPQGRQIALSVVQDMTTASVTNTRIRDILVRHQYPVPQGAAVPGLTGEIVP